MKIPFVFMFLSIFHFVFGLNITEQHTIKLNTKNILTLTGQINDKLASQFIYELNQKESKSNLYVYIDTNGGSVDAGNRIVDEIQKYNLDCIASSAISMGFVILQSCKTRYITNYSTLMQHQISYGIQNEKEKIESYVDFIKQIDNKLTQLQTNKIGISPSKFKERTSNEWWMFGENAIHENCADKIVDITCSSTLTNETYSIDSGSYTYIYSKCPLVFDYIEKTKNKNNQEEYIFFY